jgi:threonine dehydratase
MWRGASPLKLAAARGYGAAVDLEAAGPDEAFERLAELQAETGRTLVHPFDDPAVIAGQGTVGLEIARDEPAADVLVVPVGGGGLAAGIATAAAGRLPDARIVGVEPESSNALGRSLAAGEPVRVEQGASIADGLVCPIAGAHCLAAARGRIEAVTVTDAETEEGFRFLYAGAKLAAEPAGAAGVAALLAGKIALDDARVVAVVVSGGNVAAETASAILARR